MRQNTVPAVFASVRNGLGIGFYSDFIAAGDPDLVLCFRPPVPPAAEIWLVSHERSHARRSTRSRRHGDLKNAGEERTACQQGDGYKQIAARFGGSITALVRNGVIFI